MTTALTGQGHQLGMSGALTEQGEDSISPAGMKSGLAVYCGYEAGLPGYRKGGYTNIDAVKARFPGARYISVGRDAIDIEPGLGSPSDAPGFVEQWTPAGKNTNKPVCYADGSQMGEVVAALTGAGIARDRYYLWLADPNGNPAIPAGMDAVQWAFGSTNDADTFYDYMFGPVAPPAPEFPMKQGSTFATDVKILQGNLNRWAKLIDLKSPLTPDGSYGPATADGVTLALVHFGVRGVPAGECTQALFNDLKGNLPAPVPVPPVPGKPVVIDGFSVTPPANGKVEFVASWPGDAGIARRKGTVSEADWNSAITWS